MLAGKVVAPAGLRLLDCAGPSVNCSAELTLAAATAGEVEALAATLAAAAVAAAAALAAAAAAAIAAATAALSATALARSCFCCSA